MSKRSKTPKQQPAPDSDRALQKAAILVSLSRGATRAHACEAARVPRRTFYNWLQHHHSFRDAVDEAEQQPVALAEALALRCAMKAEEDPRYLRALFHFLKHRAGWGAPARRQPMPFEPDPFDEDDWNGGTPDPDESLIPVFRASLEAEDLPPGAA